MRSGARSPWNSPTWRKGFASERRTSDLGIKQEHNQRIPSYRMPINPEDSGSYIIPSNVPAFLVKLWKLVEDPQYEMHISWNPVTIRAYTVINTLFMFVLATCCVL